MRKLTKIPLWTKWIRPESIPYPNTWHKFTAKSKDGKTYKMKIVDLTPDRFDESLEFMKKYFYTNEPIASCSKVLEDEVSLHNNLCEQRAISEQRISMVTVLDEDVPRPKIVGLVKLLVISKKDEPYLKLPGYVSQREAKMVKDLRKDHDPLEILDVDELVQEFGLCVKSEYKGLNIGYNMILTVEKLARTFGIKGVAAMCSSTESQIMSERLGYQFLNEIVYDEYKDDQGQVIFPVKGTRSIILYVLNLK